MWKSRKALSPVVAAIILIAVSVSVSIAVAFWLGALRFIWFEDDWQNWQLAHGDKQSSLQIINKGVYAWMVNDDGLVRAASEEIIPYTGPATIRVYDEEGMCISKVEIYVEPYTRLTTFLWVNGTITTKAEYVE